MRLMHLIIHLKSLKIKPIIEANEYFKISCFGLKVCGRGFPPDNLSSLCFSSKWNERDLHIQSARKRHQDHSISFEGSNVVLSWDQVSAVGKYAISHYEVAKDENFTNILEKLELFKETMLEN